VATDHRLGYFKKDKVYWSNKIKVLMNNGHFMSNKSNFFYNYPTFQKNKFSGKNFVLKKICRLLIPTETILCRRVPVAQ
jgi:hypothetical protein